MGIQPQEYTMAYNEHVKAEKESKINSITEEMNKNLL